MPEDPVVRIAIEDMIAPEPDDHLGELEITWSQPGGNPELDKAIIEDASVDV